MPTATRVRMTKTMGLPWRVVQCSVSASPTGGGGVATSLMGLSLLLLVAGRRLRLGRLGLFFFLAGLDNPNLGVFVESQTADGNNRVAWGNAAEDLNLVGLANAHFDFLDVDRVVGAEREHSGASLFAGENGGSGNDGDILEDFRDDADVYGGARFEALAGIIGLYPYLHGGAGRICGRAHDRYLAGDFEAGFGDLYGGGHAHPDLPGLRLRNVGTRHYARDIDDGEQRRAGLGHVAGIDGTVRDDAGD